MAIRFMRFAFLLLFPFCVNAQDTLISYSGVVMVDSVSKNELFLRGRQWFNETFKSSKDVLQINDKETGELAGKGIIFLPLHMKYLGDREYIFNEEFSANVWVKDDKYKFEFKNFNVYYPPNEVLGTLTSAKECPQKFGLNSQKKTDELWESAKQQTDLHVRVFITSLQNAMQQKKSASDF
jgi:hypothetical protein